MENILSFLKKLTRNNNREWFEKNKGQYLACKAEFEALVTALWEGLIKFDAGLSGLNPKKLPFRIYRDVRFSKDKRPYKVNMGAGFSPGGKMSQEPGYYLHIEPGDKSFIAGGIYQPDSANLAKIRQEIDYNTDRFLSILKERTFKKLFPELDDFDKVKTAPRGYKGHPHLNLLQHKSIIVSHGFTDAEVKKKDFVKKAIDACHTLKPLNDFLWEAIAE